MTEYRRVSDPDFINNNSDDQPRILEKLVAGGPQEDDDRPTISNPKICDFIATYLVAFDKQNPEQPIMKHFFDPEVTHLYLIAYCAVPDAQFVHPNFLIWRINKMVFCGRFEIKVSQTRHTIKWISLLKSEMDTVATDSKWDTFWAAHDIHTNTPVAKIWDETWEETLYGNNEDPTVDRYSAEEIDRISQEFGRVLSDQRPWDPNLFSEFAFDTQPVTIPPKAYAWYDPRESFGSIRSILE
ncbi:hypothetical protein HBH98_057480 [Parastagonospora nodorum]|nr:hypothetical protein HBH98_057480 [Parastagonospora nodorum]KAH4394900.1 hypothetical protein HBH97_025300 [Parastagonospora nodorum]KAH4418320.1 hypothetical protein HBH99_060510 [Parastagonospora nodorum]KAH4904046.1 hypothetical protein HBI80_110990 [Parastagonospora nodorum]KAH5210830.1 hypothetical protein HBH77_075540 [Parastagonospora nodorum]